MRTVSAVITHPYVDALDDPSAPTSVHDRRKVENVRIADSLVGLEVAAVKEAARISRSGSGAGPPGWCWRSRGRRRSRAGASVGKKCAWLERTVSALGLENVRVVCARAEELEEEPFDVVTARALASLPVLCEYAAPVCSKAARWWRGRARSTRARTRTGLHAAAVLG